MEDDVILLHRVQMPSPAIRSACSVVGEAVGMSPLETPPPSSTTVADRTATLQMIHGSGPRSFYWLICSIADLIILPSYICRAVGQGQAGRLALLSPLFVVVFSWVRSEAAIVWLRNLEALATRNGATPEANSVADPQNHES